MEMAVVPGYIKSTRRHFSAGACLLIMSEQAPRRHPEWPTYRCFLSDLTDFAGFRRAGPTRTAGSIPQEFLLVNVYGMGGRFNS